MLAKGNTVISKLDYLGPTTYFDSDPLRYEKSMLDDWFRAQFAARG